MSKYILDTNIFNKIVDDNFDISAITTLGLVFHATTVQINEIENTKDIDRRNKLLETFQKVPHQRIATSSFLLDFSMLDEDCIGPGEKYSSILEELNSVKSKKNNPHDALLGEVALEEWFVFVTNNEPLQKAMRKHHGSVMDWGQFLEQIGFSATHPPAKKYPPR